MVQDFVVDTQTGDLVEPFAKAAVNWKRDSILFSSCNEDSGSELRAFGDLSGRSVLCITAGGGRVLNLLVHRPSVIWAVDLNPAQNSLLELKIAGMRALDHDAYLRFLGVREDAARLVVYERLRDQLSAGARGFFDENPQLIDDGILFQGRLERYLQRIASVLQWTHALGTRRVFECEDLEEQRRLLAKLDTAVFRVLAQTFCRRGMLRAFSGDPGFYRYVPDEVPLHREIYDGMVEHFTHHLARNNPLMQLVFFGRFINESALPAYLNAATYDQVRGALGRVQITTLTGTINHAFARAGAGAFDALSLSDISSYLDDGAHAQLFLDALTAARDGAIICSRSNIHHRAVGDEVEAQLTRDRALERELSISDHSCVHKFLVGRVTQR